MRDESEGANGNKSSQSFPVRNARHGARVRDWNLGGGPGRHLLSLLHTLVDMESLWIFIVTSSDGKTGHEAG